MKCNFPSLTRKIKCRFCGEELREKNYGLHLQRKHQNSNSSDVRGAGQTSIAAFIKPINNSSLSKNADTTDSSPSVSEIYSAGSGTEKSACTSADYGIPGSKSPLLQETTLEQQEFTAANNTDCSINIKLDKILDRMTQLEDDITYLKGNRNDDNSNQKNEDESGNNLASMNLNYLFQTCRSLSDITSIFDDFEFDEETSCVICRICVPDGKPLPERAGINSHPAIFIYNPECGTEFSIDCNLPAKFRYLKKHLKDHLVSKTHLSNVELREEIVKNQEHYQKREREVGLRIGRIAYNLYYKGRPYSDFEGDIALSVMNGIDLGDINHSVAFAKGFLPYVSESVENRLKQFINQRLLQTGFKPPVKIIADKATWKHRTRQFIMFVTVVPDSDKLIQAIYLGHPVIKAHTGKAVAESIISCISDWNISSEQYIGGSFDGQYFNLSVPNHLSDHFTSNTEQSVQKQFFYDWDPMHKAGLVDDHMRKNEKYSWVVTITQTIGSVFSTFNWGKEYEKLHDAILDHHHSEESNMNDFRNPCFYSATRFANSVKRVYENFRIDYKGIITVLEGRQMESLNNLNSTESQKAIDANMHMNKILNLKFCLRLSGLCDLYEQFSKIINILQELNVLPHERYDRFLNEVKHLKSMSLTLNQDMCPCKRNSADASVDMEEDQVTCFWPCYHLDKDLIENEGQYQGVPIFIPEPEDSINFTRSQAKKQRPDMNNVKLTIEKEFENLSLQMANEFHKNVFTADDIVLFDHVRNITDLKSLALKLKLKGIPLTAASHVTKFISSAQKVVFELKDVPTDDLNFQYRAFLNKLDEATKYMSDNDFKNLTSIDIIKFFLSSKKPLYQNIELILHCICVGSIILSIESVCESLTSKYEYHNNSRRPISDETAHHEMMISVNGALPTRCDNIITQALSKYFAKQSKNGDWHFVRRGHNIKDWTVSKSVDKQMKIASPLSFMDF